MVCIIISILHHISNEEYYIGGTCSTNERRERWLQILGKSEVKDLLPELPVDRKKVLPDSKLSGYINSGNFLIR
jgi:hypothetical protein